MMAKITPWFPGHIKPARPGVYQQISVSGRLGYMRWDGALWYGWSTSANVAEAYEFTVVPGAQKRPWRGLASDPSEDGPGGWFQSTEAMDMGK